MMAAVGKAQRVVHHDRILTELRGFITSGHWPPGHRLPFETDLAASYGVSRMTMNKVLTQLAREGFLVRRRKLGTFVARPMTETAVMEIAVIEAEIAAMGQVPRFELLQRTLRRPEEEEVTAARIADPEREVLGLTGVHHAGDQPFCFERRIVNPAMAPGVTGVDFGQVAPGGWLLREIPWTSAEHRIRAVPAAGPVARALRLAAGTPCLEVVRRTEIAGQWVTLASFTYPGDRHQLVAQFGPA